VNFPFDTWSTERIEVLRGPASVMYGEGAVGGAINVISKMPLMGSAQSGRDLARQQHDRRIAVDSGGPINKDVAYRITATGNMSDGWVDRDNTSNVALHAAVQIKQTEDVTWTISTDYGDRSPSRYFGTPLINGKLDPSLRFRNYNVGDSTIRYQDSWNQVKTEWQVADGISIRNTLYYLNSQRHWKDVENYNVQSATGLINRSDLSRDLPRPAADRRPLRRDVPRPCLGMVNEFVAGFDVNRIDFKHSNNSPYGGTSSVDAINFNPGLYFSPDPTVPGFSSVTNQYAPVRREPSVDHRATVLIAGVRQDEPTVKRTDYVNAANSFRGIFSSTSGAPVRSIHRSRIWPSTANIRSAADPVGGLISAEQPTRNSNWPPASRSRSASSNRSGAAAASGPGRLSDRQEQPADARSEPPDTGRAGRPAVFARHRGLGRRRARLWLARRCQHRVRAREI
jgi:iron complex outermembrane receptor protein